MKDYSVNTGTLDALRLEAHSLGYWSTKIEDGIMWGAVENGLVFIGVIIQG